MCEIPTEIESQIKAFARKTRESKDELVREALLSYLEEREGAITAAVRLKSSSGRIRL